MRAAIDVAEKGIVEMREQLKAGMTENELWSILHKANIFRAHDRAGWRAAS